MSLIIAEGADAYEAIKGNTHFCSVDDHPFFGGFGRLYYPAASAGKTVDASATIFIDGNPALYAPAGVTEGVLAYNGMAIRLFFAENLDSKTQEAAARILFKHYDTYFASGLASKAWVRDDTTIGTLGPAGTAALNRSGTSFAQLNAWIDLSAGFITQKNALRKSFRSLINWGRANMTIKYVNAEFPDRSAFDSLQEFHRKVAGRITRPQSSWDAMYSWIASGRGELALGYLGCDELVAASVVVDGRSTSAYATGVYDRDKFDKPLAHWPIWNAIERSRCRGLRQFDIGAVPLPGNATAKEVNIGYFKRGFATSIKVAIEWKWGATDAPPMSSIKNSTFAP